MNILKYTNTIKNVKFDYTKKEQYTDLLSGFYYLGNEYYNVKEFRPAGSPVRNFTTIYQIQDKDNNVYSLELNRKVDDIRYIEDENGIRYYLCYRVCECCALCPKNRRCHYYVCCDEFAEYLKKFTKIPDKVFLGFLEKDTDNFYSFHYEKKFITNQMRHYISLATQDISADCKIAFLKDAAGLKKVLYKNGDTYYYLKDYEYILPKEYEDKPLGWQWQVYVRAKAKLPIVRDTNGNEYFYSKNSVNNDYLIDKKGKRYIPTVKNYRFWLECKSNYNPYDKSKYDFRFDENSREGRIFRKSIINCFPVYNSTVYPIGYIMHKQWYKKNLVNKIRNKILKELKQGLNKYQRRNVPLEKIYTSNLYTID